MELTLFRPIAAQAARAYFTQVESTPADLGGMELRRNQGLGGAELRIRTVNLSRRDRTSRSLRSQATAPNTVFQSFFMLTGVMP